MKVVWSHVALERVRAIAGEIAVDHPRAAADWIKGMSAAVARLASFPESGRVVPEIQSAEIREVLAGRYRIIYRLEPPLVVVLTVRHQRQSTGVEDLHDPG